MNRSELYIVGLLNNYSISFAIGNHDHGIQQYKKAIDAVKKMKLAKKETQQWFSCTHSNLIGLKKRNYLEQCLCLYNGLWKSNNINSRILIKIWTYLILILSSKRIDRKTIEKINIDSA